MKKEKPTTDKRVPYCITCDRVGSDLPNGCTYAHMLIRLPESTIKKWRLPMRDNPAPTEELAAL